MKKTIVIIEDDVTMVQSIEFLLKVDGFLTLPFHSAEEFFMAKSKPDDCLYVVDWNLPGIKGIDVIRAIRKNDLISPIFMVTAYNNQKQIIEALDSGADDYITKPFDYDALLIKVKNAYKKIEALKNQNVQVGLHIVADANAIIKDGVTVNLTTTEFTVFHWLFKKMDQPVSREELLDQFEGDSSNMSRNIDVYISSIRKKLKIIGITIVTVRGTGYKLVVG